MSKTARRLLIVVATIAGAAALTFGVAAPPENCPSYTAPEVRAAATSAADWTITNQQPDGRWLYEYNRVSDEQSDAYNVVRHAGVMSSLYQAASADIPGALESADRGLDWALDNMVGRDDWVAMTTSSSIQAGTNALLLAGLVERRLATGDDTYDDTMRGLARFLESQTEPSGALLGYYDLNPDEPRAGVYSIYYTGEAYWALGRLHRIEPDAGWGEVADRIGHYMATERDEAEDVWPPLADHWSGYGLAETAAFPERPLGTPLTDDELNFVRRQGGLIGQRVRSISQRFGPWGVAVRGTFTPRGGGYGVFGEGLAGLWRASMLDDRLTDERVPLASRTTCIVGLAIDAQTGPAEAAEYDSPQKVEGAWFLDDVTRMDDQQHAMSALLMSLPIIEAADTTGTGHPAPPAWIWLVVIIATLNPLRAAFSLPRFTKRRTKVAVTAGGTLAGSALLLLVGATSGWLLDVADASLPAMRLAAGGLCLITAGVDLVRKPVPDDSVGDGWKLALVPVAIPIIARPALLLAGLSIVADHGMSLYVVALLACCLVVVALAAVTPKSGDLPSTFQLWMTRVVAAVAMAGSVMLIVDAVFDI